MLEGNTSLNKWFFAKDGSSIRARILGYYEGVLITQVMPEHRLRIFHTSDFVKFFVAKPAEVKK